jgi:hypothetical protein
MRISCIPSAVAVLLFLFHSAGTADVYFVAGSQQVIVELGNGSPGIFQNYRNAGFTQRVARIGEQAVRVETEVNLERIGSRATFRSFRDCGGCPENLRARFLGAEPGIQADAPEVRKVALDLRGATEGVAEATAKVVRWVAGEIRYSEQPGIPEDALSVMQNREGSCVGLSNLCIALLRSLEIPARKVHGLLIVGEGRRARVIPHRFVEVYLPDAGWLFSDPAGSVLFADARHIVLALPNGDLAEAPRDPSFVLPDVLSFEQKDRTFRVDLLRGPNASVQERTNFPVQYSQAVYGQVVPAAAACAGASVVMAGRSSRYETQIQDEGVFSFVGIAPGMYRISVDCSSWSGQIPGLEVAARQRIHRDLRVEPNAERRIEK